MHKARILVIATAMAALSVLGLTAASADPEPGGQNPAGVCKGVNDPPPCPPRNDK